jgi:hypothetical protein
MQAHFDNSENNPANPSKPPKVVNWGNQTTDEMCIGIFEFVAAEGSDGPTSSRPKVEAKEAVTRP